MKVKYICLGFYDKDKFDGMTESEREAMFDMCFAYDDTLRAGGHFTGGDAIEPADAAKTVSWSNGKVVITDGPFAEAKEQLGGILLLEARDMEHAVELMSQHPSLKYGNFFEIRGVANLSEVAEASAERRRQRRLIER